MKRGPQGRYTREFREEAVKLVTEERLSVPEAGAPPWLDFRQAHRKNRAALVG